MKKIHIIILSIIVACALMFFGVKMMNDKKKPIDYTVIAGVDEFNLNLVKTVHKNNNDNNYLISPYSIEMALNLLKSGAKGKTYDEINSLIGDREMTDLRVNNRINVANAAFIKNKYQSYINKDYYETLKNKYYSDILYDEFKSPKVINDWVKKETNGMIDKILDSIDENFTLGLANAIAIDVEWDNAFDCAGTTKEKFTKIDGENINTEMMHNSYKSEEYKYLKNTNATGVIIPYKKYDKNTGEIDYENGHNLEFVAILPETNVNEYISSLNARELNNLLGSAKAASSDFEIKLSLPRFKYDYELTNFKSILKDLGINEAFNPELADFTGIMPKSDEYDNLYVDEAIHKTHIDLNEKGTKAAAVTYFSFTTMGMVIEKESVSVNFNKPFIYLIRDAKSNEILFFGTVYLPNEWQGNTCSED